MDLRAAQGPEVKLPCHFIVRRCLLRGRVPASLKATSRETHQRMDGDTNEVVPATAGSWRVTSRCYTVS